MSEEAEKQLDIFDEVEGIEEEQDESEEESTEIKPELETEEAEDDDVLVSFAGDEPPEEDDQPAPAWVRDLRKAHRETQKENRELRKKIEASEKPKPEAAQLRSEPTLEGHDYDSDEYSNDLKRWYKEKIDNDAAKEKAEEAEKAQQNSWQDKLNAYEDGKSQLKVKDYTEAEEEVLAVLSATQQGIIVQGADNPALVVYALGKNPEKIKALAQITDPVKFAFATAKLEKDLKMVKKTKKAPEPERRVTGSAPSSGAVDSTLEKLRAEAEKTGNYTKISAYKRNKRK